MNSQLNEIREQQRNSWNKFSSGWKKWDELTMSFSSPVKDAMINAVKWKDNFIVLDVAAGTGEPGLTAAGIVKNGKVISTDLAEDMVSIAKENAEKRGLKNFETRICSVETLPFADNYFDVVFCRFGYMFFPDIPEATKEIKRVLKPGGVLVAAVWSVPEKNSWATLIQNVIKRNMTLPPPPPDSPGLFRCAAPGYIKEHFTDAGLKDVSEKEILFKAEIDTPETYWNFMTEVAAPVVAALSEADEATYSKIKSEVIEEASKFVSNGKLQLNAAAVVTCGAK